MTCCPPYRSSKWAVTKIAASMSETRSGRSVPLCEFRTLIAVAVAPILSHLPGLSGFAARQPKRQALISATTSSALARFTTTKPRPSVIMPFVLAIPLCFPTNDSAAAAKKCELPRDRSIPTGWAPVYGPKPWIVCVDLNGDKIQDQFVLIHDSQDIEVVAFVSSGSSYSTHIVFTMPIANRGDPLFLLALPAGDTVLDPVSLYECGTQDLTCAKNGPPIVHLRAPTASLTIGDTAIMFQWLGKGFRQLALSD